MEKLKGMNTEEQDKDTEIAELLGQLDPKLMPMIFGYICYLSDQNKREEVKRLCASGEIHTINSTMRLLSHQPLDLDKFNEFVPEILQAFKEELTASNFQLYVSIYMAGVIDGKHREREHRRRAGHSKNFV